MPDTRGAAYWDACVFISYINEMADRMPILDALLEESASGSIKLYTSALSCVEVAFSASEQKRIALDEATEQRIDSLWTGPGVVELVEYHDASAGWLEA